MEVTVLLSVISASCVVAAITLMLWAWRVVNWVWLTPRKIEKCLRKQGLKGNPYRLLYGDTREMASMPMEAILKPCKFSDDFIPRILPFHHHIIKTYGKNSFSWIGPVARVYILDADLIKEVLVNNEVFKKPTPNPLANLLVCGMASYEGEKWVKHRKIITPAFHLDKLKYMMPAMYMSCSDMLSKWEKLISEKGSCEFDVQPYLQDFTSDVISRTAFGSSFEQGRMIIQFLKEQAELTRQVLQCVYVPGWRFFPTKRNRRMSEISKELSCILKGMIDKRESTMKLGDGCEDHIDLLSLLLKSNLKEVNGKDGGLTVEEVINECKSFYFSGQESTSNILVWTMILLSMHPVWQQRAREEVMQVFGNNKPTFEGLNHLNVVTMILYEVLRLYSQGVILTRKLYKETKLGDLNLPEGVQVILPLILVHHDPEIWGEDSNEFKPERFSEGIAKAMKKKGPAFFPFSWGPRICIANNFAMMEAKMAITMIVRRFSFELSPCYIHAPSFVLTLQPQHGAHLILHKI